MPLHLLHHKSWHVYNTANVEKVRRDQENARLKEEAEEARMNAADQERRLQQLRGNAYGNTTPPPPSVSSTPQDTTGLESGPSNTIPGLKKGLRGKGKHVNLFEDVETQKKVETNPEREKELAIEKKKWEDQITSKFVNATNDHAPWYAQLDKVSGVTKETSEIEKEIQEKRQIKWKNDADPLKTMERFLEKKREAEEREERRREKMERSVSERERRRRERTPENDNDGRPQKRHEEDSRERSTTEERKYRHRHRSRSRSPGREHRRHRHHRHRRARSPEPDLETLRVEREEREAVEKEKIAKMMSRRDQVEDRYRPVGYHGYSAQFHPEAVRR